MNHMLRKGEFLQDLAHYEKHSSGKAVDSDCPGRRAGAQ